MPIYITPLNIITLFFVNIEWKVWEWEGWGWGDKLLNIEHVHAQQGVKYKNNFVFKEKSMSSCD